MAVDYKLYPVLFVDDETQNLVVFRYAFEEQFTILTANSGIEALRLLHEHRVAVLISDQRMPGMTGTELCARARELQPDAVRIVITAYADVHAAIDAINVGKVSRYLVKPWHNEEMAEVLQTAIEFVHLQQAMREMEMRLLQGGQSRVAEAVKGRILHEISQPLQALVMVNDELSTVFQSLSSQLKETLADKMGALDAPLADLGELVESSTAATKQLVGLTARARAGSQISLREECDAGPVVENTLRIVRRDIERTARLEVVVEKSPSLLLDICGLGQVVLNLVLNSFEAIRDAECKGRTIRVKVDALEYEGVVIVSDDGPGIQAEHFPHIFRPHFTTKANNGGLGLSIVRDMVHRVGGEIKAHSIPDVETTFEVRVPLHRRESRPPG